MLEVPTDAGLDDATVVRRIAFAPDGGDPAAEVALYCRLAPRVRLHGLKYLRDEQAAWDLAQQVMMQTLERLRAGKLRDVDRLVSFVFGTCRTTVLEWRRTGGRRERLLELYADDVLIADPSMSPRLDHAQRISCLERLPERERSVLVLTFFDDLPAREVAAAFGLDEDHARAIRHRGLARLCGRSVGAAMTAASCASPLPLAALVAYWLGELDEAQEDTLGEHLLGCGRCSANLRDVVDIGDGVRAAVCSGAVRAVSAAAQRLSA